MNLSTAQYRAIWPKNTTFDILSNQYFYLRSNFSHNIIFIITISYDSDITIETRKDATQSPASKQMPLQHFFYCRLKRSTPFCRTLFVIPFFAIPCCRLSDDACRANFECCSSICINCMEDIIS